MTIDDVMKEFGIEMYQPATLDIAHEWAAKIGDAFATGVTQSAAVCALLKARYGISVLRVPVRENSPHFLYEPRVTAEWSTFQMCAMPTELAAVAALARRIRGAG